MISRCFAKHTEVKSFTDLWILVRSSAKNTIFLYLKPCVSILWRLWCVFRVHQAYKSGLPLFWVWNVLRWTLPVVQSEQYSPNVTTHIVCYTTIKLRTFSYSVGLFTCFERLSQSILSISLYRISQAGFLMDCNCANGFFVERGIYLYKLHNFEEHQASKRNLETCQN